MFEVGDYIVYGSVGVCQVDEIGQMELDSSMKDRLYYTLVPVYENGSRVFTPVDNDKVYMRPVMSKQEVLDIIDVIQDIETLWIPFEKGREEIYKQAMKKNDCNEWIKIIKTLYLRKQARVAEGKKTVSTDEKYLRIAEEALYGEFAISLGMDKKQVEKFIEERINQAE